MNSPFFELVPSISDILLQADPLVRFTRSPNGQARSSAQLRIAFKEFAKAIPLQCKNVYLGGIDVLLFDETFRPNSEPFSASAVYEKYTFKTTSWV